MNELLIKIRAEIERLKEMYLVRQDEFKVDDTDLSIFYEGKAKMCGEMLAFIDSLPEQPVDGLEEEIQRYFDGWGEIGDGDSIVTKNCDYIGLKDLPKIARHFAKWGAEWMAGQGVTTEKTVGRTPLNGPNGVTVFLYDFNGFQPDDKVIVQIRKKVVQIK